MPAASSPATTTHFVHPLVDGLCLGGLTLLLFPLASTVDLSLTPGQVLALLLLANWPHFGATLFRIYGNGEGHSRDGWLGVMLPLMVGACLLAGALFPRYAGPALLGFAGIVNAVHSAAQNLGLTLIYAHRAGIPCSRFQRRALATCLYSIAALYLAAFPAVAFRGIHRLDNLSYPAWLRAALLITIAASAAVFLASMLPRWWKLRHAGFPLFLIPLLANAVWLHSVGTALFLYVPLFHGLQNLFLVWVLYSRKHSATGPIPRAMTARLLGRWSLLMLVWGLGAYLFSRGMGHVFHAALGHPWELGFALGVAGVTIHHYYAEAAIWRISERGPSSELLT